MTTYFSKVIKPTALILSISLALTALFVFTGWEQKLVTSLYSPENKFALFLRHYSQLPGIILSVVALLFLLIWPIRTRFPLIRKIATLWLCTLILGGGLLVHIIAKEGVDRPRPRETVLLDGNASYVAPFKTSAELKGKSFPSGHVVMGIMFAVPFFVIRRRKIAYSFLAVGILYSILVGWGRMALGAHFITDVIWAIAFVLITACWLAPREFINKDVKTRYTVPIILAIAFLIVWFNGFKLNLSTQPEGQNLTFNLPCSQYVVNHSETTSVRTELTGFGAPLSYLQLKEQDGEVSLVRYKGIYRNLDCRAYISLSEHTSAELPSPTIPFVVKSGISFKKNDAGHYIFSSSSTKTVDKGE